MSKLTCALCGSTEVIKQDDQFVCQGCGCKYSIEEAKKLVLDGLKEQQVVVNVDNSNKLQGLFTLARRAKEANDNANAAKYYNMILLEEPNNWEAYFYSVLFEARDGTVGQIQSIANRVNACVVSTMKLIKEQEPVDKQRAAYSTVAVESLAFALELKAAAIGALNKSLSGGTSDYAADYLKTATNRMDTVNGLFDTIISNVLDLFNDKELAVALYKQSDYVKVSDYLRHRLEEIDPSIQRPVSSSSSSSSSSGGCYVATAVYGSYDCPQVWTLRRYRDFTLAESWYGRAFIRTYYAISPTLVKWFGNTEWFKNLWRPRLDRMVAKLQREGMASTPYEDRTW